MEPHRFRHMVSKLCVATAMLLAACGDSNHATDSEIGGTSNVVTQYVGIFNDDKTDNFHSCLDLNPPYTLWDITFIAFLHTRRQDGVYVAAYENARGRDSNGNPIPPAPGDTDRDRIRQLVHAATAVNPRMRFVISLGWGDNDFSKGASNPAQFAASVGQIVEENGLDGFDVDFESDDIGREDFLAVSKALREELDRRGAAMGKPLLLTITPATLSDIDLATVNEYYDYVQMQSYSHLGDQEFSPDLVVGKGVASSKILFGRDIEGGDTLQARRYGIPNAAKYVQDHELGGFMGWRVNSGNQMTGPNLWSGVKLLGNALGPR